MFNPNLCSVYDYDFCKVAYLVQRHELKNPLHVTRITRVLEKLRTKIFLFDSLGVLLLLLLYEWTLALFYAFPFYRDINYEILNKSLKR